LGEKETVRAILRESLTCETRCVDLLPSIPGVLGKWRIMSSCEGEELQLTMKREGYQNGQATSVFPEGQENAVCKKFARLKPSSEKGTKGARTYCPVGQKIKSVNFESETVVCN